MLDFVIFSLSRWNEPFGTNIRDMSYELAKHHRVLYVDVPLKRKDKLLDKQSERTKEVLTREREGKNIVRISENLWHYIDFGVLEPVNSIGNNLVFDFLNRINNKRFARVIDEARKKLNFNDYILLNDNDVYNGLHLPDLVHPLLHVYYLRDRLSVMQYWKKHVGRIEPDLIRKVDLLVANSAYLAESSKPLNTNSHYIGQGCDVNHFANRPGEAAIESITRQYRKPIIGYMGALNSERLDIALAYDVATKLNDFSFVFVGNEDAVFQNSKLHQLPNVHFTGNKEFSELPKYVYAFDVAINPQLVNDITIGNYPRKIDEYLAAGIPVVATETPTMLPFSEHTYLGKSADDYVTLIRRAMMEDNEQRRLARRNFAATHNWKNSVDQLLAHCYATIDQRKK